MLFVLDFKCKLITPKDIDTFISAEIPEDDPELKSLVLKHMLHGPHSKDTPCYDTTNNTCSKHFPKKFCEITEFEENGFPKYRRRNNSSKNYFYNKKKLMGKK
jgi:hypothetical protein